VVPDMGTTARKVNFAEHECRTNPARALKKSHGSSADAYMRD